ncbi:response regulator transcription factor [Hydrogenophaga sp. 5NK40-0174]|uniref:response regulator transcription factor n=1 Tax=Hydrogenophaga sp. 5NK40-0174 TaxID=3127649 RepID=UPI00310A2E75
MAHLLIVEDDELLRDGLSAQLIQAGHRTTAAEDGERAQALLQAVAFDGVVLDLGLPKIDGLTLLRGLRTTQPALPVLILTARDGVDDRIEGLNAGADDYLTKPFNIYELAARVQSMLRRASLPAHGQGEPAPAADASPSVLRMDPHVPRAWLDDKTSIDLTQREWTLLKLLLDNEGRVVSREDVVAAWQAEPDDGGVLASNTLEVYVHRLRRKLGDSCYGIRNIRGLGYMLECREA